MKNSIRLYSAQGFPRSEAWNEAPGRRHMQPIDEGISRFDEDLLFCGGTRSVASVVFALPTAMTEHGPPSGNVGILSCGGTSRTRRRRNERTTCRSQHASPAIGCGIAAASISSNNGHERQWYFHCDPPGIFGRVAERTSARNIRTLWCVHRAQHD